LLGDLVLRAGVEVGSTKLVAAVGHEMGCRIIAAVEIGRLSYACVPSWKSVGWGKWSGV
jgi:hypothetical protein